MVGHKVNLLSLTALPVALIWFLPAHHIVFDPTLPESLPDDMDHQMYPRMDLGIGCLIGGIVAEETMGIAKTRLIGHRLTLDQDKMDYQPPRTDAAEEISVELQQIRCLKKRASVLPFMTCSID